ncbi:MAG: glycosyltransferase family 2 protein [Actinomycetota bacterium]|nr:glycosyltransferase family 2 protein [Actinomycetota bacterium]
MNEIDVSIVLPVYNEAGHVRAEIERIRAAMTASEYAFEIVVVDDASTDGSRQILQATEDIRLIELARNRGVGNARRIGTKAARGRVVVWTDVDMSYPNDEMPTLVKALNGYDQVVGARRVERGTVRHARSFAKWIIRRLASYLVQEPIPDLNSGFRAFRRDVGLQFLHLLPRGFSCVTTMTMTFLSNGYSVGYLPIDYGKRAGRSKFHWWTDTKRYATQVIRLILSYEPLRIFVPIGFTLFAVGTSKLIYDWATKDFRLAANTLLIFFASLQLISIGFVADLIVRSSRPEDLVDPAASI